ncbi:MAG: hypothetical protein PWP65_1069 [Clostridia bacterium]|nr:hypothetical protein [Clostridia bacterium]
MKLVADRLMSGRSPVSTLYLGGGTPSLLSPTSLSKILKESREYFPWKGDIEVTLEANPGTVDLAKLRAFKDSGVNRLSLGAQSFNERLLKAMGRVHTSSDINDAVSTARKAGFTNLNLDLIYGLPGQDLETWEDTLEAAISLSPEHISIYCLELDERTPWGQEFLAGRLPLPGEDLVLAMYYAARAQLEAAGYRQYEISNFSRPGYECRHNIIYWENGFYLGLGVAAASHYRHCRWENPGNLEAYQEAVFSGRLPRQNLVNLSLREEMAETMFMGLRLISGVDLAAFYRRFKVDALEEYGASISKLKSLGLLKYNDGRLALTAKGLPLANVVFREFI